MVATSRTTTGRAGADLRARRVPAAPATMKLIPSVSIDGLVTTPLLPTIDAPAACVAVCSIAIRPTGTTTTAAAASRRRIGIAPVAIAARTAAPAGAIHTGHDRNTPTPHAAASQR